MTRHEAKFCFQGGEITLKHWRKRMPVETLARELSALASTVFDSWQWTNDGEAGLAIEPVGKLDALLLIVDNPTQCAEGVCL
jgi:hypothetical protein